MAAEVGTSLVIPGETGGFVEHEEVDDGYGDEVKNVDEEREKEMRGEWVVWALSLIHI